MEKLTLAQILQQQESSQKKISLHEELLASLEKVLSDGVEKAVSEFKTEAEKTKDEVLTELKTKTEEAEQYVKSLKPVKGDRGNAGTNYILTNEDKTIIAGKIKVPVVEKVIEKTEVIKEQPIIKEVAVADTGDQIIQKINSSETQIDATRIKGLPGKPLFSGGRLGRGTGSAVYEIEFSMDGSTKSFTIPNCSRVIRVNSTSAPFFFSSTNDYTTSKSGNSMTVAFGSNITALTDLAAGQTLSVEYVQST